MGKKKNNMGGKGRREKEGGKKGKEAEGAGGNRKVIVWNSFVYHGKEVGLVSRTRVRLFKSAGCRRAGSRDQKPSKPPLVSDVLACRLRYSRFGSDTFTPQR